ncbi:MAG TPA: DUF6542 domain-containing protein [Mycobacteriales bacterium]|nr:DUF6542 domain-containing protein [Mycobacteriales bacterium]
MPENDDTTADDTGAAAATATAAPARADVARPHLPAVAHLGDVRGITAAGAVAVALGSGVLGALIDVTTGSGLRTLFTVMFTLGCAIAAYKVHREDLAAAVVIPPLAYLTLAFLAALFRASGVGGGFITQQVLELFSALVLGAPALLLASSSAGLVAGLRWLALRTAALDAAARQTATPQG